MLLSIINLFFTVFTLLLMCRVVGSWFPRFSHTRFMQFIAHYTDPYLNIFRRIIPPIGGMVDISPMFAFIVLQFLQYFLIYILR
jgi:YggT family protein